MHQWICGMWMSVVACLFNEIRNTCMIARSSRWDCCTRCIGHSARQRPRAACASPLCTERAGIEAGLTITREADERYLVVTACATQTRDITWLRRHIPDSAQAVAV